MTRNEFVALCLEYDILPEVALEAEAVRYALMWSQKATDKETGVAIVRNALEGNF
jgi:hypothetical protein